MSTKFCCPRCGSENVQSLPIIYQSGSSGNNSITQTGKIISVTQGESMTNLARSVAPPSKKENFWWLFYFSVFVAGLWLFGDFPALIGILAIGTAIYSAKENNEIDEYNKKVFPALYEEWENSFLCHRCGHIFRF